MDFFPFSGHPTTKDQRKGRVNMEKEKKEMDREAREYFQTLPASVQEQLMQSGVSLTTREELEACRKHLMESGSN